MTTEEALKIYDYGSDEADGWSESKDIIMIACEKQIPRKPVIIDAITTKWHMCPRCYEEYGFDYDILIGLKGMKTGKCHCLNCGQAIDLEVEE